VGAIEPTLKLDNSGTGTVTLRLTNSASALAFFVRVRLAEESETLRMWYGDNYLAVPPGETKSVEVTVESRRPVAAPETLKIEVSGWNVPAQAIEVAVQN
jgi:hypothetical protein